MIEKIYSKPAYAFIAVAALLIAANFAFGLVVSGQERALAGYEATVDELKSMTSPRHGGAFAARARIEKFTEALPEEGELTSILNEVFKAALRNGVNIPTGAYNPVPPKEGRASRYVFTLPVEGRYADLKRFLYELESSPRPLVVEEVTLSSSRAGESRIGLGIKISVYYR